MDLQMSGTHRHPVCGAARSAICDQRERTPSRCDGDSAASLGEWRSAITRAGGKRSDHGHRRVGQSSAPTAGGTKALSTIAIA